MYITYFETQNTIVSHFQFVQIQINFFHFFYFNLFSSLFSCFEFSIQASILGNFVDVSFKAFCLYYDIIVIYFLLKKIFHFHYSLIEAVLSCVFVIICDFFFVNYNFQHIIIKSFVSL